ncbi:MAG TPA: hypothetical protein VNE17_09705 [Nitrolancea sp.]|nr:hypothetical protein [Nitrolancea sp.]
MDTMNFGLSVVHGVFLTVILIGLYHLRGWLLFARLLIGLVAAYFLFLFIDGLISGPLGGDTGLLCGGALAVAGAATYGRLHQPRRRSN